MVLRIDPGRPAEMRNALIAELRVQHKITSDAVEAAMRRVPREPFMPEGTDLAEVYGYDNSVVTKRH